MQDYDDNIKQALELLYDEAEDLLYFNKEVPQLLVTDVNEKFPLVFYRDYVAKNYPVLIKNGVNQFPAVKKWNSTYFRQHFAEKHVTVTLTPNGYADGIAGYQGEEYFFLPEEVELSFGEFLNLLSKKPSNCVGYIQQQNSNLTTDFSELLIDVENEISWASEAFNKSPDAINFWMGDERAITSSKNKVYSEIFEILG